jgi:hypothetical protein
MNMIGNNYYQDKELICTLKFVTMYSEPAI